VGSHAAARTSTGRAQSGTTTSPLPFPTGDEGHRNLPSKETQTTIEFNLF